MPTRPYAETHTFCIAALQLAGEQELYELLVDQGRFSADFLRPVVQQLAAALQHVHSRGYGHFDLKLENVRITCPPGGDPEVTLVDFGLAVNLRNGDRPTQTGSLGIAAPELCTGTFDNVDTARTGAADIFSFGIVVFTLAFGYAPWAKATKYGEEHERPTDAHGRGFQKYADLSEPGRLLAYATQTPVFKKHLSSPAPTAPPAPPAPVPMPMAMATGPTLPLEGDVAVAPAPAVAAPPTRVPAPSDPRLIDLLSKMLQIDPAQRPTAEGILVHDWITTPVAPVPVPATPYPPPTSCSASDDKPHFASCSASDADPHFTSCGVTPRFRSLGDSAPPVTELVLPKLTRTHAVMQEGYAFAGFSAL